MNRDSSIIAGAMRYVGALANNMFKSSLITLSIISSFSRPVDKVSTQLHSRNFDGLHLLPVADPV